MDMGYVYRRILFLPNPGRILGWLSRYIMVNRCERAPKPVYEKLLELVMGKDYFQYATNVDQEFWITENAA